jgi:hypothetical protein
MHLINDCRQRVLTDQLEHDVARLAEHNRQVRLVLSDLVSWCRRLLACPDQRFGTAAERRTAQRGLGWSRAGSGGERDPMGSRNLLHGTGR